MSNKTLLKALEAYSGAFLISVIWGEIAPENMNKYRVKISRRLTGKCNFGTLEIEKINTFLNTQKDAISEHLSSV
jgi:hypothetical protein